MPINNITSNEIKEYFAKNKHFVKLPEEDKEYFINQIVENLALGSQTTNNNIETNPLYLLSTIFGNIKETVSKQRLLLAYLEFHDEKLYPKNKFRNNPNQRNDLGQTAVKLLIKSPELIKTYKSYVKENYKKVDAINDEAQKKTADQLIAAVINDSLNLVKDLKEFIPLQKQNLILLALYFPRSANSNYNNTQKICEYLNDAGVNIPTDEEINQFKNNIELTKDDIKQKGLIENLRARETKRESFVKKIIQNMNIETHNIILSECFNGNNIRFQNHIKAYVPFYCIDEIETKLQNNPEEWKKLSDNITKAITIYAVQESMHDMIYAFDTFSQNEAIYHFQNLDLGTHLNYSKNISHKIMNRLNDFKLFDFKDYPILPNIESTLASTTFPPTIDENNLDKISDITAGMIAGVYNVNTIFTDSEGVPGKLLLAIKNAALKLYEKGELQNLDQQELQNLGKNIGKDLHGYLLKNKERIDTPSYRINRNIIRIGSVALTDDIVEQAYKTMKDPQAFKEVKKRNVSTLAAIKQALGKLWTTSSNKKISESDNRSGSGSNTIETRSRSDSGSGSSKNV